MEAGVFGDLSHSEIVIKNSLERPCLFHPTYGGVYYLQSLGLKPGKEKS